MFGEWVLVEILFEIVVRVCEHILSIYLDNGYIFCYNSSNFWILSDTLKRLKEYKEVKVPIYNFVTHRREERMVPMYGANVIIFEGIFAFHDKKVVDLLDMKVGFCLDKEMRVCVFSTYWSLFSILMIEYWYRYFSIWKSYWSGLCFI